ncbi:hypothetical protein HDV04_000319 [Boothiomyces sp. JEL0838]|nr:hypothetical protein HDV04_000319 [Boothiomyces sp. JEL0838]
MAFTANQLEILNIIVKISASLGVIGFILLFYQFIKYNGEFKSAMGKIVIVLALGDLMDSCVKAIGPIGYSWGTETPLCQFQGSVILFANNSSIFNSLTIGLWAVYLTYFNGDVKYILRNDYKFIGVNLCIACTFALLAALLPPSSYQSKTHMIGNADLWCFISSKFVFYQMFLQFIWVFIVTFLNTIFILLTWRFSTCTHMGQRSRHTKAFITRLLYYLAAFLIVWIPITINRMVIAATGNSYFILAVIQAMFSPSRGFYYALAFILSKRASSAPTLNESTSQISKAKLESSYPNSSRIVDVSVPDNSAVDQYENIFEIDQYFNV